MDLAFRSEKGNPALNEDACWASTETGFFLVCDGLGPHGSGAKASRIAGEVLGKFAEKNKATLEKTRQQGTKEKRLIVQHALDAAFQETSREIFQAAGKDPNGHGMCTTVDCLLFLGSHALIAHVGAGRVYLLRNRELHLLTEDHNQLAHLRRSGKIAAIPANQHGHYAKRLTRAVGFQEQVKVDLLEVEMQVGDKFLLVTDGVWLPLGEEKMDELCAAPVTARELLESLHEEVRKHGAKDNYTTIVVEAPAPRAAASEESAEQKIKMLGKVSAFRYLSYQELIKVINTADLVKVGPKQVICKEGDPGGEMMLILSGSVEITKNGQRIRLLGKGDVFGELSMIDAAQRSATIVAREATNLLAFPRETLFGLFREEASLAVKFLWGVTMETNKRMRMMSNKMVGRPEGEGLDTAAPSGPHPFDWRR